LVHTSSEQSKKNQQNKKKVIKADILKRFFPSVLVLCLVPQIILLITMKIFMSDTQKTFRIGNFVKIPLSVES
jgi:hypothetical protein